MEKREQYERNLPMIIMFIEALCMVGIMPEDDIDYLMDCEYLFISYLYPRIYPRKYEVAL